MTDEESNETKPKQPLWGWPPSPKMQVLLIAGVCVLINVVLIGIWVLVLYLR